MSLLEECYLCGFREMGKGKKYSGQSYSCSGRTDKHNTNMGTSVRETDWVDNIESVQ